MSGGSGGSLCRRPAAVEVAFLSQVPMLQCCLVCLAKSSSMCTSSAKQLPTQQSLRSGRALWQAPVSNRV